MAVLAEATFGGITYRGGYFINQYGFIQFQGYPVETEDGGLNEE